MDHGQLNIILVNLGLTDEDEIGLVKDGEVSEVVNVPDKSLYVPCH